MSTEVDYGAHMHFVTVTTAHGNVRIIPVDKLGADDPRLATSEDIHRYVERVGHNDPIAMEHREYRDLVVELSAGRHYDPTLSEVVRHWEAEPDLPPDEPKEIAPFLIALDEIK